MSLIPWLNLAVPTVRHLDSAQPKAPFAIISRRAFARTLICNSREKQSGILGLIPPKNHRQFSPSPKQLAPSPITRRSSPLTTSQTQIIGNIHTTTLAHHWLFCQR